jgi:hypothetical protein
VVLGMNSEVYDLPVRFAGMDPCYIPGTLS